MADAQGIALIISSTTALLAVGAPFALRWWEERDRRMREKKSRIEGHLFFVLDNYRDQTAGWVKYMGSVLAQKQPEAKDPDDFMVHPMREFSAHMVKLRSLAALDGIEDAGFCSAVDSYGGEFFLPTDADAKQDFKRFKAEAIDRVNRRTDAERDIEKKAITFLRNIEGRLGYRRQ